MNIRSIIEKLEAAKNKGFVPSMRRGPTGVGHTMEQLTGLRESNINLPDFGSIELKTMREQSSKLITLLTFNRGVWQIPQKDLIKNYGYYDNKRKRLSLYSSVVNIPNNQGLFCTLELEQFFLRHITGNILAIWPVKKIRERLIDKIQTMLLVKAKSKIINEKEHFWYFEASILTGCNNNNFFSMLKEGKIILDLRMHLKESGSTRNHGTGFRMYEKYLEELYLNKDKLI